MRVNKRPWAADLRHPPLTSAARHTGTVGCACAATTPSASVGSGLGQLRDALAERVALVLARAVLLLERVARRRGRAPLGLARLRGALLRLLALLHRLARLLRHALAERVAVVVIGAVADGERVAGSRRRPTLGPALLRGARDVTARRAVGRLRGARKDECPHDTGEDQGLVHGLPPERSNAVIHSFEPRS